MNRLIPLAAAAFVSAMTGAASAAPLPNVDATFDPAAVAADAHGRRAAFLWAGANARPRAVGALRPAALAVARARAALAEHAAALGLSPAQIDAADARLIHGQAGGSRIVRLQQRVAGREVFNRRLDVLLAADGRAVAMSGGFAVDRIGAARERLNAAQAVLAAIRDAGGRAAALTPVAGRAGWQRFAGLRAGALTVDRAPRAKTVWFALGDTLQPAWQVELIGRLDNGEDAAYATVFSATDGRLLFRKNLVEQAAHSYRVFADADGIHQPFDSPLGNGYDPFPGTGPNEVQPRIGAPANLVTLDSGPISTGDPWLPEGATTTTGNNTDAYLDTGLLFGVAATSALTDGFQPRTNDERATLTGPAAFDHAAIADADPSGAAARQSAIVNLFYMDNWLHDFYYDRGLDEAAGNAQADNYGRGGEDGDPILAEGQDASGRNNANMLTPSDGSSPRMQMYLFDGPPRGVVNVATPAPGPALTYSTASFGPRVFELTAPVVLANERNGDSATDGCLGGPALPVTGTTLPALPDFRLRGKIALIDRGSCSFTTKVQFATLSGAVGVVIINNEPGADPIPMGNADLPTLPINLPLSTDRLYRLPTVMIRKDAGDEIRARLAAGVPISMYLKRDTSIDYDGTLDNQIVVHEFFHYVSNRLVGNATGLSNSQGRGMGEGWSDFAALLLTVRPEDTAVPGNAGYEGAYPLAYYSTASFSPAYQYYGIRRQPYSRDFRFNSLTFRHIEEGVPLPDTAPLAYGGDGSTNAFVHSTGEIWSNMLWEGYSNLLLSGRYGFEESRRRMLDYVIAGLKLTPNAPTILEARDAILAAALAVSNADHQDLLRGFAKRGAGIGAVAPPRNSTTHAGVVESYAVN